MPSLDHPLSSRASFAHVLCATSSAVDAIAGSALPIFDSDHGSVVFTNNVSSDITYTAAAGTFTFSKAGTYHVVLTLVSSQETANGLQTATFGLNSDSAIYTGAALVSNTMDPTEITHQRIITVAADDVLHIKAKTHAQTMGIVKGTSVVITEITSGVYASSTVTTAGSNNTTSAFNPFDTDLSGGPVFATAGKIASGVTFTQTAGSMTVPSPGKYLIMINHLFAAGGTTNSNISMLLVKTPDGGSGATLLTNSVRLHSNTDPFESTMCVIEDLETDDALTVSYDIGSGRCQAEKGATFTVIKLQEGAPIAGTGRSTGDYGAIGHYGSAYASVVSDQTSAAGFEDINPFDEGNLTGDAEFTTRASRGITFDAGAGTFTVDEPGLYFIMHNPILVTPSDVVVTTTIKVNDVIVASSDTVHIDSLPDPMNLTNTAFVELQKNDVVTVFTDANTEVNLAHSAGSHITMFRYFGFFRTQETLADGLINDDLTIDTFSQGNLSVQYDRGVDQVPFKFGIRGPGTLRGRGTEPSVIKIGDKKS